MPATDDTRHPYFPYIDGLRALAVLSVIAYHLDARLLPGGFTGVDVFFVISGFVVSASMAHLHKPRLFDYLGYFYSRRIRRIAPALIACLMVTGIASALFIPQAWLPRVRRRRAGRRAGARDAPGDVLFLPALRLPRYADQWASFDTEQVRDAVFGEQAVAGRHQAEQMARDMLKPLAERGIAIVFEAPKPVFRSPPYRCADWFSRGNPACRDGLIMQRADLQALRKPVLDSFANIAAQVPGVSVWDPFPILCPGPTCRVEDEGHPLYFDADHISGYANRKLMPAFVTHLSAAPRGVATTAQ